MTLEFLLFYLNFVVPSGLFMFFISSLKKSVCMKQIDVVTWTLFLLISVKHDFISSPYLFYHPFRQSKGYWNRFRTGNVY